jgi:hypothetical protein
MVDETRSRRDGSKTYAQSAVARIRATLPTWKNVRPVDGEVELVSGIWSIQAPGHSPAHTAHLLSSGGSQLLATADVSLHSASFLKNPEWQVAVDQVGPTALATRKRIFDRAIASPESIGFNRTSAQLPKMATVTLSCPRPRGTARIVPMRCPDHRKSHSCVFFLQHSSSHRSTRSLCRRVR